MQPDYYQLCCYFSSLADIVSVAAVNGRAPEAWPTAITAEGAWRRGAWQPSARREMETLKFVSCLHLGR